MKNTKILTPSNMHHLQHSDLDTMHIWTTYSTHDSNEKAKMELKRVIKKFPFTTQWRVVKLTRRK